MLLLEKCRCIKIGYVTLGRADGQLPIFYGRVFQVEMAAEGAQRTDGYHFQFESYRLTFCC